MLLGCGNFKEQVITQPFIKNYMQALVKKENEPITPFISKIRSLLARGVSSILVMGGSGDYFGVSDTVLRMDSYKALDVTAEALAIDKRFGAAPSLADNKKQYGTVASRTPVTIYPGSPSGDWHDSDAATHLALSSTGPVLSKRSRTYGPSSVFSGRSQEDWPDCDSLCCPQNE